MAFTAVPVDGVSKTSTTPVLRLPIGNRFLSFFHVDEIDATGSSVDLRSFGVGEIDFIAPTCSEAAAVIQVAKNSITNSTTEDDPGQFWCVTSAGTHDAIIAVVYKLRG